MNPLRLGFFVQWEWIQSLTPESTDPAVDVGFSHLTSVQLSTHVNVKMNMLNFDIFPGAFLFLLHLVHHVVHARCQDFNL